MNHIYKSIFNKALGVFTAVPEFASAHGKGSERTVVGRVAKGTAGFAASALAISVGLALTSTSAVAAGAPGIYVNNGNDPACITFIDDINVAPAQIIYGGSKRVILPDGFTPGTALSSATGFNLADRNPCVAVGGTAAENHDTQTNRTLFYNEKQLTLGGRLDVNSGIIGVGDRGVNGAGATNSIRMGTGTTLDDANKKTNAISIGVDAGASALSSTAIGANAKARADYSVALGDSAVSGNNTIGAANGGGGAIAIGRQSMANNYNAIAIGVSASVSPAAGVTTASDGIAIGSETVVDNYKGIAVGAYSQAKGRQSTVIANNVQGSNYSTASGNRSQVYGAETNVSGNNSVAIGDTNTVASERTYAIGNNINVAAGTQDSLAFGTRASVEGIANIAMGKAATTHTHNSIAIGSGAESGGKGVNDAFYGTGALAIGGGAKGLGTSAIAIGQDATVKDGHDSIAMGVSAKTTNNKAISIGAYNEASGLQSTVIGSNYNSGATSASIASGTRAQVYGVDTKVSGNNSVAIGDTNTIASARTYALGNNINVKAGADDSLAFGTRAAVGAANTVAIGANANAAQANSVALGAGSTTDNIHEGGYTLNSSYTAAGLPNAANGTVSVGSKGKERQIQNVAAGVISATSTDAINGSQLYATNNYINNFAGDVKTKLGGNAILGNDGHLTMTNIGGTGKDNVNDAIAAAKTEVAAGDNITVTSTTNADGSKTYTVATKKDLVVDSVKAGDTTVNTDGVTIANGPSITKSGGINANGRKVTGVVNGDINSTSTDAVNGSQLHATNTKLDNVANALADTHFVVDTKATTGGELDGTSQADQKIKSGNKVTLQAGKNLKAKQTNSTDGAQVEFSLKDSISLTQVTAGTGANQVVLGNDGVQVGGNTYINKDGLNANSKPISNVADGVKPKDAVNKGQLDAVAQEAAKHTTVKAGKNVEVSEGTNAAGGKEYTVKTADNLNVTSVKAGDSTLNTDGLTITGGPSVKKDGINAGDKKITGVADGNVAAGSKDAVNGGQLAEVKAKADSAVQNVVSANPTALTVTKAGDTVTLTPNFIAGDLVNPATGEVNTPAADDAGKLVTAGTVAKALAETHFVVDTKATTGGELDGASQANQKIKSSNKVTLQAGKNLKAKQTNGTDGAQVEFSLKDSISLTQVTAGTGDNQVVLGKDGVQVGGNTYINKDGINAAGKAISNVANGNVAAYSKDAVNGGQLHDTAKSMADVIGGGATVKDGKVVAGQNGIGNTGQNTVHGAIAAINQNTANNFNQIRGDLRKMDRDLRGSIAGTLATAGLPQAFSPGKSMVAAAAGTYRGQSGLAVGVSRISDNGKVILKVTGNTNSRGDFGGTIGAGYQW